MSWNQWDLHFKWHLWNPGTFGILDWNPRVRNDSGTREDGASPLFSFQTPKPRETEQGITVEIAGIPVEIVGISLEIVGISLEIAEISIGKAEVKERWQPRSWGQPHPTAGKAPAGSFFPKQEAWIFWDCHGKILNFGMLRVHPTLPEHSRSDLTSGMGVWTSPNLSWLGYFLENSGSRQGLPTQTLPNPSWLCGNAGIFLGGNSMDLKPGFVLKFRNTQTNPELFGAQKFPANHNQIYPFL